MAAHKIGVLAKRTGTNAATIRYMNRSTCCRLPNAKTAISGATTTMMCAE